VDGVGGGKFIEVFAGTKEFIGSSLFASWDLSFIYLLRILFVGIFTLHTPPLNIPPFPLSM
jgi:hypothetical protein